MTKLNQESGRSMVEMLGVLAIIGVLSIGGIAGYTMAMNRYRANETLSAAAQLAVLAQTMNQGNGGSASLETLGTGTTVPGASAVAATHSNGATTITITTTSEEVSKAINSIVGGSGCSGTTCNLKMENGRLAS
ncbi:MAG: hypothetical protein IKY98_05350 [Alphaproteobacteria bacterium]|nr:hypothetical protein [Alphaproteobacteria bacterium]